MTANTSRVLTLAEVEEFDPQAPIGNVERRFWCPLCGANKPRDAAHRCLCINTQSGLWNCKRCGEKGLLGEFQQTSSAKNISSRREHTADALRRAFSLETVCEASLNQKTPEKATEHDTKLLVEPWRAIYEDASPVAGSPGAAYLARRAVPLTVAERAGVLFSHSWHGRPTLVFPFRDQGGAVVAIAGRCLRSGGTDKPAAGPKKQGAFFAPVEKFAPLDQAVPAIVLCEAPFDALALASAGFPALALGGTTPPVWLARSCAYRHVALAFDADIAGDATAKWIGGTLCEFGATSLRLRPEGAKDWNEYLQRYGVQTLSDLVALHLL